MAAPIQRFENSRNSRPRQQFFPPNEMNQGFQRIPQQQQSFQQFNPRFPPPGIFPDSIGEQRHGPPNVPNFPPPKSNFVRNMHESKNEIFHQHSNRVLPKSSVNIHAQITASNYVSSPFNSSGQHFGNKQNVQHAFNEEWSQQMIMEQNMQPSLNIRNQIDGNSFPFHQDNISSQQEKWHNDSTLQASKYSHAEDDKRWLQDWLQHRQQQKNASRKDKPMKISEAQEKTRQMIVLLARLQKSKQILETLKHEDRSIWNQKLKEVLSLKNELEVLQKQLTSEDNIRHLQATVSERKKKRERMRQRKRELYEQNEEMLAARERKHAEIDKSMQQLIEKQKLDKQEKDMQKEADEILSQVRKKLTETNRSVQVIDSLQKLRKLRTDRLERQEYYQLNSILWPLTAVGLSPDRDQDVRKLILQAYRTHITPCQKGVLNMYESQGHSSTNKLMFEAKLSNMRDLLNQQLEIYRAEEAALKVHLETEQEETREKEREKTRQRMIERQKQERKKEENMLFGSQKKPVPGDPIYPFRHYYDAAKHSLDSLVAIRREWDSYLSTAGLGSCIPDTWVIPVEPSSESWGSALKHDQMT